MQSRSRATLSDISPPTIDQISWIRSTAEEEFMKVVVFKTFLVAISKKMRKSIDLLTYRMNQERRM